MLKSSNNLKNNKSLAYSQLQKKKDYGINKSLNTARTVNDDIKS